MVDASIHLYRCNQILSADEGLFTYPDEATVHDLEKDLAGYVRDRVKFPVVLEDLPSKPFLFQITPLLNVDKCQPCIY